MTHSSAGWRLKERLMRVLRAPALELEIEWASYANSPFLPAIVDVNVLSRFTPSSMKQYDGITDLDKHVIIF